MGPLVRQAAGPRILNKRVPGMTWSSRKAYRVYRRRCPISSEGWYFNVQNEGGY